MRILAADDDRGILKALERLLRSWGYDVLTATDGAEALRILKGEDAPRIAILDWDMPGLSGLEVCRLLRSSPFGEGLYVLMLTGRSRQTDLIEALEVGADDFVAKPFDARELQLRLAKGVTMQARRPTPNRTPGTPPSGVILGGKYRLEKEIAEGGMATVWLGVHLSLGVNVAIKFMKPGVSSVGDHASFEREARAAARLRGEHVVRVYDHGFTDDGDPYLVMDFLAGESLAQRIDRLGPAAPSAVATIIEQVGRALTEAHGHGIVHGDVKPENILIVDDHEREHGCAKLVDFGLARSPVNLDSMEAFVLSGTPSYMSPEHLRGLAPANPALDLWALAMTAFTALTGRLAFDGETVRDIVQSVCTSAPPVPSSVNPALPKAVDAWFARACARGPEVRPATAAELTSALVAACAGVPAPSPSAAAAKTPRALAPTEPAADSERDSDPER